ncbi:MAG: FHA domain-containing protein [Mycobacteriales bacterium]
MGAQVPHAGVEPGDGLVGRFGTTLAVVAPGDEPFTEALLAVLGAGESDPDALAWQLAKLLVNHAATAPAFGVVVRRAQGYQLLLRGPVRAQITGSDGDLELSGSASATWLDRLVPDPVRRLAVTLTAAGPVRPDPRSNLQAGLVPGCAVVLTAMPMTEAAGEPTAEAPRALEDAAPAAPLPARETGPARVTPAVSPRSTLDLAQPAGAASPAETTAVQLGSVGVLVADDGTRTPLDRSYVLGREPQQDSSVQSGAASPIVVRDPDNLVSRVQVHVSVDAQGVVTLRDDGSANGTFVAAPGATEWVRVGDSDTVLPPGWSMRLGRRVFTHVTGPL